ncbi:hypothetical protein [Cedecea colo]|uniref:Uncharacterized protein n=1 Tax=Cedecea colo TaxID=2552946 RepID=A0ABX0VJS9_9ENTR|nr:hypothetical protein [Cedecea colo]NIY47284.1 hypothetical protein [Cedecea colo]
MFNPIKWFLTKKQPENKEKTVIDTVEVQPAVVADPNAEAVKAAVEKTNTVYYAAEDVEKIFDVAKYAADKLGIEFFAPVIQHLKSLVKPVNPE